MILDKLFQLMAEKQASDIFISAGTPIHIKIQGNTMPVNQQTMLPASSSCKASSIASRRSSRRRWR